MQQFIGCNAHKKFSVFLAVNEKGQAGEAIRVEHDRRLYREFLLNSRRDRDQRTLWLVGGRDGATQSLRGWPILWRPSGGWARPRRPTWTPPDWRSFCAMELYPKCGFHRVSCAISASRCALFGAAARSSEESDSCDAATAQRVGTGNRSFRR